MHVLRYDSAPDPFEIGHGAVELDGESVMIEDEYEAGGAALDFFVVTNGLLSVDDKLVSTCNVSIVFDIEKT